MKDILLILDRGFYSANNLNEMAEMTLKFIIPLPKTNNLFFSLVRSNQKKLLDYRNAFLFQDEVLFHTQESVTIKNQIFEAHLYFNQQQFTEQSSRFIQKIIELEQFVLKKQFNRQEAIQYLKNTQNFLKRSVHENVLQLTRKPQIMKEHVARFGVTIMLTNRLKLERDNILDYNLQKDQVEKIFDTLKNEFDGKRLRSHSKETIEGRLFIKFIALIYNDALDKTLRTSELKQFSIREIMYELKKIKVVEMCDGKFFLTEISKRQKNIFKAFNVEIPVI